ncbi:FkbM family methyltransferase [Fulvivirga lutea]|uniref:FkbM family methyltransferase n=1 Tax=Fulvivirga lutea TaxID=2810512 RepID=A0A975A2E1_9BACT|nr:FkbM family methyltransferase [Fulvivirga lutea]QSE98442.1 FkbM family methyltransferase [Fulvivirga lutea]
MDKLPKGLIDTHIIFRQLLKNGFQISRDGGNNLITGFNNLKTGVVIKRDSSDASVLKQILIDMEYEPVVKLLQNNNIMPDKIIDAGANIGLTTLYLKSIFPDAIVIALEPNKSTFLRMRNNFELNGCLNVISLNIGIWNSNAFLIPDNTFRDGQDWSFRLIESDSKSNQNIEVRSLESLLDEYKWDVVDFLKVDIEGAESKLFENKELVQNWLPRVKAIAIEIHDEFNCKDRILRILSEYQFQVEFCGELSVGVNQRLVKKS